LNNEVICESDAISKEKFTSLQYLFNAQLKEIVCYYLSKRLFTGSNGREFNTEIIPEFIKSMFVYVLQVFKGVRVISKSEKKQVPSTQKPRRPCVSLDIVLHFQRLHIHVSH